MGLLKTYRTKRKFAKTPEPRGRRSAKRADRGPLHFVIQKHHARALHYDFRIEAEGVLKSWAVPKGPSDRAHEARLAVATEDHPLEYGNFEGTIPKGHYGAGTVKIWDRGLYTVPGKRGLEETEKAVIEGLAKGRLTLTLRGRKTVGDYAMVRMKEGQWLMTKKSDFHKARLTNLEKIYFPKDKITKGDLIKYYESIAPYLLPYLRERPESLRRMPNGVHGKAFYQKNLTDAPKWFKTVRIKGSTSNEVIQYPVIEDVQGLLYVINLGCIDLHPWFSRKSKLDHPDFLVIDLDPDDNPFSEVIKVAKEFHLLLDKLKVPHAVKTSGASGIHIGIPLEARYTYDEARVFAERVARLVHKKFEAVTSLERNPGRRRGKIYLDCLQNRRGQTLAAPYCVRPLDGAPVSMPVTWKELKPSFKPGAFTLKNALKRIKRFKDPWRMVLGPGVILSACARRLDSLEEKG